jgi:hypothetical protein
MNLTNGDFFTVQLLLNLMLEAQFTQLKEIIEKELITGSQFSKSWSTKRVLKNAMQKMLHHCRYEQ